MRKEGYYFVKIWDEWTVAKYYTFTTNVFGKGFWNSLNWNHFRKDSDLQEIGQRIIMPDEPNFKPANPNIIDYTAKDLKPLKEILNPKNNESHVSEFSILKIKDWIV